MSIQQLVPLILLFPLIGGIINGIAGKKLPKVLVGSLATIASTLSFVTALVVFFQLNEPVKIHLFRMIDLADLRLSASLLADNLSLWMVLIITGIGSLIHLFSMGYMKHDAGYSKFFT
jgi:NADH-quinone oxidoreductase subunit L